MSSRQDEKNQYRRVPGLRWGGGRSVLRLADDHLLMCDYRTGFVEHYKRFYFRDIEAIIVRKTMHWIVGIAIWGFIALCFFIIGSATHWNVFLYGGEGICALFVLRHAIRGPSCRTHIQTAVQTDGLPMLKRVRKVRRVLGSLFPLIEAVQGKREEMPPITGAGVSRSSVANIAAPQSVVPVSSAESAVMIPRSLSWLHVITFTLATLSGLLALWEVNLPNTSFITLIVVFCLSALSGIVALVRQARQRVHGGAAALIWVLAISYVAGGAWVNTGYSFVDQISRMEAQKSKEQPLAVFREISPMQMRHMAGFDYVLWAFGIFSLLLGLIGLILAFMPAPARLQPPPLPKDPA